MPSAESLDLSDTRTAAASSLKPFSLSLSKAKPVSSNTKPVNPRKRPHSSLAEDDSETDDTFSKAQLVSAFDHSAGGAISLHDHDQKKGPLVIQAQKNLNWLEESHRRKGKNLLPPELQAARVREVQRIGSVGNDDVPPSFGLTLVRAKERNTKGDNGLPDSSSAQNTSLRTEQLQTEDGEAIDALLGNRGKSSTLILPSSGNNNERGDVWAQREHEDDAFQSDIASRPDPATLDDYAAVPVDEFGTAMLRGMGWKGPQAPDDKSGQVKKPRELVRRPALLGIGAKELPDGIEELGAWGKAAKVKRKTEKMYNPVLLKNSVTGEMITEEELKMRKENQKTEEQDVNERRDRSFELDTQKGQRKLEAGEDSRRKRHSRRGQSRSTERNLQNESGTRLVLEIETDLTNISGTACRDETGAIPQTGAAMTPQGGIEANQETGNEADRIIMITGVIVTGTRMTSTGGMYRKTVTNAGPTVGRGDIAIKIGVLTTETPIHH